MAVSAELREQIGRIAPVVLAAEQVLPVPEVFHDLLPGGGLQRGWTVRVEGGASARAMAWALLGGVTTSGGWVAAVDVPGIGLAAAREVGVAIERVLVVNSPDAATWSAVIGALIGAVDVVMFGAPRHRVVPSEYRRMSSRARERGSVLFELASAGGNEGQLQYDLSIDVDPIEWEGLGQGYGCLQGRAVEVEASGRRIRGRSRTDRFALPAPSGTIERLERVAEVIPLAK
ncbi:MAG: hypothetical protein ACR2P0_15975 [Acidimicrobiales bacterium]